MASFPTAVNPPSNYNPPNMASFLANFLQQGIGDLPQDYYQGKFNAQKGQENDLVLQQQQQQAAIAKAFPNGLPIDQQTGQPDFRKIAATVGGMPGGLSYVTQLAPFMEKQGAGTLSPLLGGSEPPPQAGQPGAQPQGGAPPAAGQPSAATGAPPASAGLAQPTGMNANAERITGRDGASEGEGPTLHDFVSVRVGNRAQSDAIESEISKKLGIDAKTPLTQGQQNRVNGLVFNRLGAAPPNGAPSATTAPTFSVPPTSPPNAGSPAERVAQGFGGLPPQMQPLQPQPQVQGAVAPQPQPQQPPNRSGLPPATAAVLAPQGQGQGQAQWPNAPLRADPVQAQQQPNAGPGAQQPQGPVWPRPWMPPGFKPGQEQTAINALENFAATTTHPGQKELALNRAEVIKKYITPQPLGATQTLYMPATGQVVAQGPNVSGASTFSPRDARLNALRSLNGDYSWTTGLGRGAQRGENFKLVTGAIEDIGAERGLNDEQIADTLATANAEFQGRKASERTLGTMEARMGAAAFEAKGAIQLARGVIEKVPRTSFLPWNQLQQGFSKQTLNPDQAELFARTQGIINTYAAVMSRGANVTTDAARGRGEELFNTAVDAPVYNRVLDTITSEINMAINSPEQMREFYRNRFGNKALSQPTVSGQQGAQGAQQQTLGTGTAPTVIQYDQNGNRVQ